MLAGDTSRCTTPRSWAWASARAAAAPMRATRAASVVAAPDVGERAPGHELHHDERAARVLTDVVHRHDAHVRESGGGRGFPPEPGQEPLVVGQLGAQHLDRDRAREPPVDRLDDLAHAAASEGRADLVSVGEQRAEQGRVGQGGRHAASMVSRPADAGVATDAHVAYTRARAERDRDRGAPQGVPPAAGRAHAGGRRPRSRRARGRGVRLPRAERCGQDDDDPLPAGARRAERAAGCGCSASDVPDRLPAGDPSRRLDRRGAGAVPAVLGPAQPRDPRAHRRHRPQRDRRVARAGRAQPTAPATWSRRTRSA